MDRGFSQGTGTPTLGTMQACLLVEKQHPFCRAGFIRGCALVMLVSCLGFGCSNVVPHPPGFSDFQRAFRKGTKNPEGIEALVEVFSAAMLSDQEIHAILVSTNARAMIGAGLQGRLDDSLDIALLDRATEISSTDPVAWAALAYRSLELLENQIGDFPATRNKFGTAIKSMQALAPSNSVPVYLQAAFECLETNIVSANQLTIRASLIDGFDTYETSLKMCIVSALEASGYPKFTARIVASGNAAGIVAWSKLSKAVLAVGPATEEARACLELGARVARGGSFLDKLVGGSIQMKAMEKIPGAGLASGRRQIGERKERIKSAAHYLDSARTRNLTEKQWAEYYDRCFGMGEMEAVQWLAHEMGDTF